jgi:hypothetical protein
VAQPTVAYGFGGDQEAAPCGTSVEMIDQRQVARTEIPGEGYEAELARRKRVVLVPVSDFCSR